MSKDVVRQLVVAASAVLAVVGAFFGSGAAGGTRIQDAADGALSADATHIAPGGPAFSIWSLIYLGLIAYAVWQFLPGQRESERHRTLGYYVAASMLLNAAWILSAQAGLLALSVAVIAVLLVTLVLMFLITLRSRPSGVVEALVVDGTIGLYLGWVCVATIANVAAWLKAAGFDGFGWSPDAWGAMLAAAAGVIGIGLAVRGRGRFAVALALCWGLSWIAVARLQGEPVSVPTAIAAIVSATAVIVVTVIVRLTTRLEREAIAA